MPITQQDIERCFSVNEVIASGGGRRYFRITEILNDRIRIQPTVSPTSSRLKFDKLSVVIENFDRINPKKIERSVGEVLIENGLQDTQNESYLYGMAREYMHRQNMHSKAYVEDEFERSIEEARSLSKSERKKRLKFSSKIPRQITIISSAYQRNQYVVLEVLERANGICESCKSPAPFIKAKDGTPYLEVHHIVQLAHGGEDTVKNAMALCPNCHRKKHFGINA